MVEGFEKIRISEMYTHSVILDGSPGPHGSETRRVFTVETATV
jgi:hypothetical protein